MADRPLEEREIQELVTRAREGDHEAFARLYTHYFLPIYRYTAFRCLPEMAEDLVADVFVKAWEKLHQYRPYKDISFGAWLFRIARHTVIDAYRTQRDIEEISEEMVDPDRFNRPESRLRTDETLRIVRQALATLPRRYREILVLCYIAELPHSEVARILRTSEGSVRILKFRALRRLQAALPTDVRDASSFSFELL